MADEPKWAVDLHLHVGKDVEVVVQGQTFPARIIEVTELGAVAVFDLYGVQNLCRFPNPFLEEQEVTDE